ncbi:saccharopine dehydrogenase NADP-binding domain-containing protein [Paenibacillus sp. ACRRX]|uniref:saccharopine dehydrogenase family protein n=1 Tax=Paenibacillus sp. ACRRX TaxID=2918206 RepID=UPI001EF63C52|nr:saccharopine dehydrogenase NADP-binding domain-containing protein [Paenibacillus sp. ACRRX]MCG7409837.1 saccharopine dehydrogenase NADP-binding domain-containing protein [Paenibacillus sp. ACRRX]
MNNHTIGILGAAGNVGREAVRTMIAATEYPILLGGRKQEQLRSLFSEYETRINVMQVDVYDAEQLHQFCRSCTIVVNCAGPSKQMKDIIAVACLEQGVHYVDVSGDEHLYQLLLRRAHEIEAKNLVFLISAGAYPGLSEILPAYTAVQYFDEVHQIEVFFAGQGGFSINAAYDIVCSIKDDTGMGMNYSHFGKAEKMTGAFHRSYELPPPAGLLDTYPILNSEFQRMADMYNIQSAYFYNTYPNKSVLNQFVMIKALKQYNTEAQKQASAATLTTLFHGSGQAADHYTMFYLTAVGSKDGRRVHLRGSLLYPHDWNALSGIVAAQAARLIAQGHSKKPGCFFVAEGIDVSAMMDGLIKYHQLELAVTECQQEVDYERT